MLASYAAKREAVTLEDIGFVQQAELFDRVADRAGRAPPVVDAEAVRADPAGVLRRLCAAIGIAFDPAMLAWPAGPRASDGVWAPHWYGAVLASTGFTPPDPAPPPLPGALARIADAARPSYDRLRAGGALTRDPVSAILKGLRRFVKAGKRLESGWKVACHFLTGA